jgi:hypothetical protein
MSTTNLVIAKAGLITKSVGQFLTVNSPTILTGLAVGGFLTTIVMVVDATPKAIFLIKAEEDERRDMCTITDVVEPLSKIDIIKVTYKVYIPAALMSLVTIGCIVGSNSINLRRNAALASAYSIIETTFKEYQEKVVETIGKNKEIKIRDDIAQDKINANPVGDSTIIITGKGETLCYDTLSGRYFKSDVESIRRIQNELNHKMLTEMVISVNDLYYELKLDGVGFGKDTGWGVDQGMLDIHFSAKLTPDYQPCIVLSYSCPPKAL